MSYPVSVTENGVNVKPELMIKEKLYHCIFKDKVLLFFKDSQDVLNCYEVEEKELVDKVKSCANDDEITKIFESYVGQQDLNN